MKRVVKGLKSYFSDKKNRLVHVSVGISMLIVSIFDSINPYLRIGMFGAAVAFNLLRMRYLPGI